MFVRGGNPDGTNQLSVVSDGRGGLIATWQEGDGLQRQQVTAQRLDASGTVCWDSSGVVVTSADSDFTYEVSTVSDGRGGAIVGWTAVAWGPTGVDSLVVQRIDSLGNLCWSNPGLVMATESIGLQPQAMCSDNVGGACITWDCSKSYREAIVEHIDSAGCPTWPGAGVLPFASHLSPVDIMPLPGGYIIAGASSAGIRAQRIDDQGQLLWGPDGSNVYSGNPGGLGGLIRVLPGPDSSSFVIWSEERNDTTGVYAQFLSGIGERRWDSLGVPVGSMREDENWYYGCVAGGIDGFIVSWPRNSRGPTDWDIYAQHVDVAGRLLWGDPGLGIATDSGRQMWAPCVVTDARQGAILVWGNVYYPGPRVVLTAQRAGDVSGIAGPVLRPLAQSATRARPSPARSAVEVFLHRPSESVVIADAVGRVVRVLPVSPSDLRATWDLRDVNGSRVPAGVYVFRQRESGTSLGRVVVVNP